eukprot:1140957-Pelagomonas_calceolata.AAC.5
MSGETGDMLFFLDFSLLGGQIWRSTHVDYPAGSVISRWSAARANSYSVKSPTSHLPPSLSRASRARMWTAPPVLAFPISIGTRASIQLLHAAADTPAATAAGGGKQDC